MNSICSIFCCVHQNKDKYVINSTPLQNQFWADLLLGHRCWKKHTSCRVRQLSIYIKCRSSERPMNLLAASITRYIFLSFVTLWYASKLSNTIHTGLIFELGSYHLNIIIMKLWFWAMLQKGYHKIVIWAFVFIFITLLWASFCLGNNIAKQKTDKLLINVNKTEESLEI